MEVTKQEFAVAIAQMHAITLTIAEVFALGTFVFLHPLAVAIGMIAILPHFHEVVFVDVSLIIDCPDAGTGSDRTVGHYRPYRHTSLTGEETTAHLTFVIAKKALTTIVCTDTSFLTYLFNIVEDPTEFLIRESHVRIEGCTTYRKDGKESPTFDALRNQEFLDVVKFRIISTIDAGDDVEKEALCGNEHVNGLTH